MTTILSADARRQRAQSMGREGYALAEDAWLPGLFRVYKADASYYLVDLQPGRRTCTCTDFLTRPTVARDCKHILFTERCLTSAAASDLNPTREQLQASLYQPSRLDPVPAARPERISDYKRRELAIAARRGTDPDLDF